MKNTKRKKVIILANPNLLDKMQFFFIEIPVSIDAKIIYDQNWTHFLETQFKTSSFVHESVVIVKVVSSFIAQYLRKKDKRRKKKTTVE